ncbi:MAG: hypothetical protein ABW171_09265 [Steroidobacter sp.]
MKRYATLLATCAALLLQPAFAADSLHAKLEANKVIRGTDGTEQLSIVDSARPGDVVEYRATYTNVSSKPLHDVMATLPVPGIGIEFLLDTARPAGVEASLDGMWFARAPLRRLVRTADGKPQQQLVPTAQYRFLRWPIGDLAPGESKSVSTRVRLTSGPILTTN